MEVGESRALRVLEFYSGIGGMRYALEQTKVSAMVVEAFEINDMANDVYESNFRHRPNQGNIQHLTMQKLDGYEADVWLLSPPCQPYTRQGLQKDAEDSRASSFLKLLEMLPLMSKPPNYLFIENVVGFECSVSHDFLMKTLKRAEFSVQEFILTPLQLGIPYSRPRYFCLAKRRPLCFLYPQFDDQLLYNPGPIAPSFPDCSVHELESFASGLDQASNSHGHEFRLDDTCAPLSEYLEEEQLFVEEGKLDNMEPRNGTDMCAAQLDCSEKRLEYKGVEVPDSLIDRWGDAFDVVTPNSKKCCCFTKSYGRFVKGTGSFLATTLTNVHELQHVSNEGNAVITKSKSFLRQLGLRYFTPREIANLHSFPKLFKFPDHITVKQRYALLGNSLSVAVVKLLLGYLFLNN